MKPAELLRWKADCLDPPGLSGTERLAARTRPRDHELAQLYRGQADILDRFDDLENDRQRTTVWGLLGWVIVAAVALAYILPKVMA
jgi:hypothetical protein